MIHPRSPQRRLLMIAWIVAAVALGGCTTVAAAPTWTFPVPVAAIPDGAAGHAAMPGMPAMDGSAGMASHAQVLEIHAFDLGFQPANLTVPAAGTYGVTFVNDGSTTHDLTFPDGTKITAESKQAVSGLVSVPSDGVAFVCSIPGHAEAGMKGTIVVAGSAAPATATAASPSALALPQSDSGAPPYVLRDATAPTVLAGKVHDVELPIVETDLTVAKGFVVHAWTFGGTVPGPVIRVHLGDTVRVHLTNHGSMSHSIDFHASQTAMNDQMVEIKPGASFTYTFNADYAGVWMYHCGTAPALHHIANGMFGMVIVEPKGGLARVDREIALVQSEWYLAGQKEPASLAKASAGASAPDFVVFNGIADQYKDNPIAVPTKGRVRVFVLDAGPNSDSSFHVAGTIFDTVVKEGVILARGNAAGWGSQAVDLAPAQGAIVELSPLEDGMYPFVTHAFNFVGRGGVGIFTAGDGDPKH
jgi:nitrite reductase (NO-forming)